jgi:putative transposase
MRFTTAPPGQEVILMKARRHSPEQIVRKLREADGLLAEGADVVEVCRHLEVSVPTYQRWRHQFKAMRPEDVVRLKALEKENARLKRLLADKELDNDMLGEIARGKY